MDPWQQYVLRGALGERVDESWQSFEVGLVVPRQNGKGSILEALELAWLFYSEEDRLILHSAHEFKTAREAFFRLTGLIEGNDQFRKLVRQTYAPTGGEAGIDLHDGTRIRFVARGKGQGRGFSGDKLVFDEAYNLPDYVIDAMLPSVGARPNPQVWYTSSAADEDLAPCDVLGRIRRRGLAGDDDRMSYFEWSVEYDEITGDIQGDPADPRLWAQANPSLGIRKTYERIANFQASMSIAGFAREELGVGNWPPLDSDDGIFGPRWRDCRVEPREPPDEGLVLGVAVSIDRAWTSLGAATPDEGRVLLAAVDRRRGTFWVVDEVVRIHRERNCPVVIDSKGPGSTLIGPLEDAGVDLTVLSTGDVCDASADLYDRVQNGTAAHMGHPDLDDAHAASVQRPVGDRWAIGRKVSHADVSMLEACTLAAWALNDEPGPAIY